MLVSLLLTDDVKAETSKPSLISFLLPLTVFLGIHLVLRLLISPSLYTDDADLILFNQALALGYSEQPPLFSWLLKPWTLIFGENVFSLTLFRSSLIGGIVCFFYLSLRRVIGNTRLTVLSSFSLLFIPLLAWHALTYLTHSLLLCVICVATFYVLIRILQQDSWINYFLFGLLIGLGMLSKYNYIFYLSALITAGLATGPFRRKLLDWRILIAVATSIIVCLPHFLWILDYSENLYDTYSLKSSIQHRHHLMGFIPQGTVKLILNLFLITLPTAGLMWLLFPQSLFSKNYQASPQLVYIKLIEFYFAALGIYYLIYTLASQSGYFHERWLEPFFFLLPAYFFLRLASTHISNEQLNRLGYALLTFAILYTGIRCGRIWLGSSHRGQTILDYRFTDAAAGLQEKLPEGTVIITNNRRIAGNLLLHIPNVPCISLDHFAYRPVDVNQANSFCFVWESGGKDQICPYIQKYSENILGLSEESQLEQGTIQLESRLLKGDELHLNFRILVK